MTWRIKDWSSYQSYKDRKPPWIRLHKSLLDDYEFHRMSKNARALLPMLWLLASEDHDPVSGMLRIGYEKIAFRLRMDAQDVISGITECVAANFLEQIDEQGQLVTEPLRNCHAGVTPETETYREETEKKENTKKKKALPEIIKPDSVSDETWAAFTAQRKAKKAPINQIVINRIDNEATKAGWTLDAALQEICMRNWQGFKADWVKGKSNETHRGYKTKSEQADDILAEYFAEQGITAKAGAGANRVSGTPELRAIQHVRERPGSVEDDPTSV